MSVFKSYKKIGKIMYQYREKYVIFLFCSVSNQANVKHAWKYMCSIKSIIDYIHSSEGIDRGIYIIVFCTVSI